MELTIEIALALYGVAALIVIRFDQELRPAREMGRGVIHRAGGRVGTGQVAHHDKGGF